MAPIILDANLARQLSQLGQPVELADTSGKVIGRFVPEVDASEWEQLTPDVSEEELDRRESANEKTFTTAEVIKHLESLSCIR
jgi:hypothetical protein